MVASGIELIVVRSQLTCSLESTDCSVCIGFCFGCCVLLQKLVGQAVLHDVE